MHQSGLNPLLHKNLFQVMRQSVNPQDGGGGNILGNLDILFLKLGV